MAEEVLTTKQRASVIFDTVLGRDGVMVLLGMLGVFGALLFPLPPLLVDIMIILNIAAALLLLMTTIYMKDPLELSSFPSMLLLMTLYRLALNVSTTRLILSDDHDAGVMVENFGTIVAGDNEVIGCVIFIILIVLQFVVITKGSTRIAEVSARFTLDKMPGLQMAIDADLNAGSIDDVEASSRRKLVSDQASFFGAMDGASKWVRGDAVAGLIITAINIAGGFIIGVAMQGLSAGESFALFTRLTIGDGLVSQVPALIIAVSSGLIITRSDADKNLAAETAGQLINRPTAIFSSAAVLLVMGGVGLFRTGPTLLISAALFYVGYVMIGENKKEEEEAQDAQERKTEEAQEAAQPEVDQVDEALHVDPMELEVGYALIPMVDPGHGGDLLESVTRMRQQIARELGLVIPPIRIRDNMQIDPDTYSIRIRGALVASGIAKVRMYLAMDPGVATEPIEGIKTTEPAFGLTAYWIDPESRDKAAALGYTVVDPPTVVMTHLTEVIKTYSHEILSRESVSKLINGLKSEAPNLIEDVIDGKLVSISGLHKVLQSLLREQVSIRNLETILETLSEISGRTRDVEAIVEYVRVALARDICRDVVEPDGLIYAVTIDPAIEDMINTNTQRTEAGSRLDLQPASQNAILGGVSKQIEKLVMEGHSPVILCNPMIRLQVRRLTEHRIPGLVVLSYNELIPEVEVDSLGMVTLEATSQEEQTVSTEA